MAPIPTLRFDTVGGQSQMKLHSTDKRYNMKDDHT